LSATPSAPTPVVPRKLIPPSPPPVRRAQQTAEPLAKSLGIKIEVIPARDSAALLAKLRSASGSVLVVGHSNTKPELIKALGVSSPVTITEQDYDDLFLVVPGQPPRLIHLHYR
jgi:hypothetical protein